jgi:hypothetical protein
MVGCKISWTRGGVYIEGTPPTALFAGCCSDDRPTPRRRREVIADRLANLLLAHAEPGITKPFDHRRWFAVLV